MNIGMKRQSLHMPIALRMRMDCRLGEEVGKAHIEIYLEYFIKQICMKIPYSHLFRLML